jgi:hypothetical protein
MVTPETGAATRLVRPSVSNSVIARVPLQPRRALSQNLARPTPNGETTPRPVTTTRELSGCDINRTITLRAAIGYLGRPDRLHSPGSAQPCNIQASEPVNTESPASTP